MSGRVVADYRALSEILAAERENGRSIALTNGCFDLLHVGHVRLLTEAATLADLLVVALNSDASTRAIKGAPRPVVPLAERLEIVAAIAGVDFATSFDELTAGPLLTCLRPDLHVKGTDWTPETVPERDTVTSYGGRVVIAGDPKRHASSDLVAKLRPA